jgi:exosortase sorting signal-containing protein
MSRIASRSSSLTPWLLAAILAAPALGQSPKTHMLSPQFPALVDTNGDGRPTPGVDATFVPSFSAGLGVLTLNSPWGACSLGSPSGLFVLSNPQAGTGKLQTTSRSTTAETIAVTLGGFTPGNAPTLVNLVETTNLPGVGNNGTGTLTLLPAVQGGFFDTVHITGSQTGPLPLNNVDVTLSFVTFDVNGDGIPDYISLPWGQLGVLGLGGGNCTVPGNGGPNPQVFVPLASDGTITLDLDGNGAPDPQFFSTPPLASMAPACTFTLVPTSKTAVAAGETNSFAINASFPSCVWTATSNAAFLTGVTAGGTGTGTVSYTVAANVAGPRTGTITAGGQTFTVNQDGVSGPASTSAVPTLSLWGLIAVAALLGLAGLLKLRQGA